MVLTAMPRYLGVEPHWISSWHGEHSRAAWPPPLHRVAITLCRETLANKGWEQGWSLLGHSQEALPGLNCMCMVLYRAVWCYVKLYIYICMHTAVWCCAVLCGAVGCCAVLYSGQCYTTYTDIQCCRALHNTVHCYRTFHSAIQGDTVL